MDDGFLGGCLDVGDRLDLLKLPDARLSRFLDTAFGSRDVPFALISVGGGIEQTCNLLRIIRRGNGQLGLIEGKYQNRTGGNKRVRGFFLSCLDVDKESFKNCMVSLCQTTYQNQILYSDGESIGLLDSGGTFKPSFDKSSGTAERLMAVWSETSGYELVKFESVIYTSSYLSTWLQQSASSLVSDLCSTVLRENYSKLLSADIVRPKSGTTG